MARLQFLRAYSSSEQNSQHAVQKNKGLPALRAHRVLVEKPEGKIPRGRPRIRWEDNIEMELTKRVRGLQQDSCVSQDTKKRWAVLNAVEFQLNTVRGNS